MTTEEKLSEVDEFFGLVEDDDTVPVAATVSIADRYGAGEALAEGALVELDRLMEEFRH